MSSKRPTPKLSSIDELLLLSEGPDHKSSSPENSGVTSLLLSSLIPFHKHPFKLYEGKKLDDLIESVLENGVLIPVIVRPMEQDFYEILSGHNRVRDNININVRCGDAQPIHLVWQTIFFGCYANVP